MLDFGLGRVETVDVGRFTEKEIKVFYTGEVFFERVVGVNREVGGDDGESGAVLDFLAQEIGDGAAVVVFSDAGGDQFRGHRCCI